MKSKSITASLLVAFIIFLLPINAGSGVLYLKNGKAIANAKDIEIKDQDIHYTVEGKVYRIKLKDVQEIGWISNEPQSEKYISEEIDERYEDDKEGPFLYPKGGKYDWSKPSDEPVQKLWGYEIPIDPDKRKQYFEDMEEENRRLETEIFGRPLD